MPKLTQALLWSILSKYFIFSLFLGKPCVCEMLRSRRTSKKKNNHTSKSPKNTFTVDTVAAGCGGLPGRRSLRASPAHVSESVHAPAGGGGWPWRPLICTATFAPIRATCTGCQPPACVLGRAPARSPSPAAGCGSDAAAASFPPTRSGAEARAPAG